MYGLNEHTFENKRVANRGCTCTSGVIWILLQKRKWVITLETNTNPVEVTTIGEHGW